MKYLCLAYGSEKDWKALTSQEQSELLAQDEVLRKQGNFMSAVETQVTTVTAWDGTAVIKKKSFAETNIPLAGFSIIEADSIEAVVRLVANTPCARARGAIEIRALASLD